MLHAAWLTQTQIVSWNILATVDNKPLLKSSHLLRRQVQQTMYIRISLKCKLSYYNCLKKKTRNLPTFHTYIWCTMQEKRPYTIYKQWRIRSVMFISWEELWLMLRSTKLHYRICNKTRINIRARDYDLLCSMIYLIISTDSVNRPRKPHYVGMLGFRRPHIA